MSLSWRSSFKLVLHNSAGTNSFMRSRWFVHTYYTTQCFCSWHMFHHDEMICSATGSIKADIFDDLPLCSALVLQIMDHPLLPHIEIPGVRLHTWTLSNNNLFCQTASSYRCLGPLLQQRWKQLTPSFHSKRLSRGNKGASGLQWGRKPNF